MSREEVLNMLRRQAVYDTRGGVLIGGRAKARKAPSRAKAPSMASMMRAASLIGGMEGGRPPAKGVRKCAKFKVGPSGKKRCAKYIPLGSGCGMCGSCGGVLEELPEQKYREAEKKLKEAGRFVSADWCPPYRALTRGPHKLPLDKLEAYVTEVDGLKRSETLKGWREHLDASATQRRALAAVGKLFQEAEAR